MRLLVGIAEMGIGGAEAVVEELAIDRRSRGDDVAVASAGGFRADRLAVRGVELVSAPMRGQRPTDLVGAVRTIRRDMRRARPDLVHVHNVKAAAVLRAASLPRRLPTLVTLHGVADGNYASAARVLRRCSDRLVAVSSDVADRVVAAGYPRERTVVIENAITAPPAHDRAEARARLGLPLDVPVAVCVARLVDQKRHDLLVDAWRTMPPDCVLLVVGDGPNRERIAATGSWLPPTSASFPPTGRACRSAFSRRWLPAFPWSHQQWAGLSRPFRKQPNSLRPDPPRRWPTGCGG
jgi:glycosyltransferase involved in cell wall biosynthesis